MQMSDLTKSVKKNVGTRGGGHPYINEYIYIYTFVYICIYSPSKPQDCTDSPVPHSASSEGMDPYSRP